MSKKINKRLTALVYTLIFSLGLNTAPALAEEQVPQKAQAEARSALLMDVGSGKILYEQNAKERLAPASVTKVMTLLLIYEAIDQGKIKWDDIVNVSDHAAGMGGSQIFLEPGEQQTVRDLTKSVAIASANDAAVAMAEFIGGNEPGFVNMMNQKAAELMMRDTHFENACGLDSDQHYTTALDIALMSRELMSKYPEVKEYTTKWQDTIVHRTKRGEEEFGLTNTNKLIKWYDGTTGLKTGSTGKALYCLSAVAERSDLGLISVILAAPDPTVRFREAMKLLDYGYANYAAVPGKPVGTVAGTVPVHKGKNDTVNAVVQQDIRVLVDKGNAEGVEAAAHILPTITAPFEAGAKVGEIVYIYKGEEAGRADLVAETGVQRAGLLHMTRRLMKRWFE